MTATANKTASPILVIIAFATVYLVWGSTYYFIQQAIQHIPALILGIFRFITAGLILLAWCMIKGEQVWKWQYIKPAIISGILLLFIGNGAVIWAEKTLPSSLVAVLVSSSPLWFVLLDKRKWKENFSSRKTLIGLVIGFAGVVLLFSNQVSKAFSSTGNIYEVIGILILLVGSISWAAGSLYSKHNSSGSGSAGIAWQMLAGGIVFIPASLLNNEWSSFHWKAVPMDSWLSLFYLIFMGSLAAYSAYVWLLQVRPATQVSTYAYVNPIVAVLLGVFFAGEKMNAIQITGLLVILASVLLINLVNYKKEQPKQMKRKIKSEEFITYSAKEKAICN